MNPSPPRRRSYDTALKHLVRIRCEAPIPPELLSTVSASCLSRWRRESPDKYTGCELNQLAAEQLELLQEFARHQQAQRLFKAYARLVNCLITILSHSKQYHKTLRNAKTEVINVIERVHPAIAIEKAVRFFRISRSTYQSWLQEVKFSCDHSQLLRCRKHYPGQLANREVEKIKQFLTDPKFMHWPIISIAYFALRTKQVLASPQTWYRYHKILGLNHPKGFNRSSRYRAPLRAKRPNQYWHADITIFKTEDGVKHYIYLVVDNFSRKILSWKIANRVSGAIRVQTLIAAWHCAGRQLDPNQSIDLIVDGGPENNNHRMDQFLNRNGINLQKKIALKDILFSNSMVEAANKLLKYRYLFPKKIANGSELIIVLGQAIVDFNQHRPHGKLNGLTPDEAYYDLKSPIENLSSILKKAQQDRRALNQQTICSICD